MRTEVVTLGTGGGPTPKPGRSAPCHAVRAGQATYLVDCGNGVARQLVAAGIPLGSLAAVFVTHLHSDHTADLGFLFQAAWSRLRAPVDVLGPPPLADMVGHFFGFQAYDIATRIRDEGRPPLRPFLREREISGPGVVHEDARVRVTAALVDHPPVVPAFGYRFDTEDRSVVFSGDTAYCANLAKLAEGADVLVHEAVYPPALEDGAGGFGGPAFRERMLRAHSTVGDAARTAEEAGVATLVLTSLFPPDGVPDEVWKSAARREFGGEVVVATDLMVL
ncbi:MULTISPECIES: MBL fold metallo-hydrolase [Amycolatopsis]|uniref:MBL fold metallo-hydrolase n=1 Tax=Amycolatopsis albidoflavus TaxID=102226 RepID=A0ABW5ICA5_9PSEU